MDDFELKEIPVHSVVYVRLFVNLQLHYYIINCFGFQELERQKAVISMERQKAVISYAVSVNRHSRSSPQFLIQLKQHFHMGNSILKKLL